jgi:hypothetical protein
MRAAMAAARATALVMTADNVGVMVTAMAAVHLVSTAEVVALATKSTKTTKITCQQQDKQHNNQHGGRRGKNVNIGLVESPFQHTCLKHLQDCVVNGD